jgi:hypothetical protein
MAVGQITLSAQMVQLDQTIAQLGKAFTNTEKATRLKAALEKAVVPVVNRLRQITPEGPTGNLRRAIDSKIVEYPLDGNAVAIVGFRRSGRGSSRSAAGGAVRVGPDRAFHQWFLEEGTQPRRVADKFSNTPYKRSAHQRIMKSGKVVDVREHTVSGQGAYIASSYKKLVEFRFQKTPRPPRGSGLPHRVQTEPGYPRAFFKKSKNPITIPPMPAGGSTGRPPLRTAFNETQSTVAAILVRELSISLADAWNSVSRSSTGSLND